MKNSDKKRVLFVLAIVLLTVGWTGCDSTNLKLKSAETVSKLGESIKAREDAMNAAIASLVADQLNSQRLVLRERWHAKKAEAKYQALLAMDKHLQRELSEARTQLDEQLDPVFGTIRQQLQAAKAAGPTQDEVVKTLTLQAASTLAVTTEETQKMTAGIREKYTESTGQLLLDIDAFFAEPDFLRKPVSSAEIQETMSLLIADTDEYKNAITQNIDAINGYIKKPTALDLFSKGLLGEKIHAMIAPAIATKVNGWTTQLSGAAEKAAAKVTGKLETYAASKSPTSS